MHSIILYQRNANQNYNEIYYLPLIRMTIIIKSTNNKCLESMEKGEPSHPVGGNAN